MGQRHLRIHEAAAELGVSRKTVRRWLRGGRLPFVLLPSGERRVPAASVAAILQTYTASGITGQETRDG